MVSVQNILKANKFILLWHKQMPKSRPLEAQKTNSTSLQKHLILICQKLLRCPLLFHPQQNWKSSSLFLLLSAASYLGIDNKISKDQDKSHIEIILINFIYQFFDIYTFIAYTKDGVHVVEFIETESVYMPAL